jgi:succinoglycan biosynthesis protein ExoO
MAGDRGRPDVSVVIAAYNAARTVLDAVESALRQEGVSVEVLACDDASGDRTVEVLETIDDPRFRLFRNDSNQGPGFNRDFLIERSNGDYVAFLDADDCYEPGRLARLVAIARSRPGCLVFDDIIECHDSPQGLAPYRRVHGRSAYRGWLRPDRPREVDLAGFVSAKRLLVKPLLPKTRLVELGVRHSAHRYGEDGLFLWRAVARGMPAIYVPEPLYRYRVTPGSLSLNPDRFRLVAACLSLLAAESIGRRDRRAVLARAAEFEALAVLRATPSQPRGPKLWSALRYFGGDPRRFGRWLGGWLRRRHYARSRLRHGAPTR